jgi:hypothetical protein
VLSSRWCRRRKRASGECLARNPARKDENGDRACSCYGCGWNASVMRNESTSRELCDYVCVPKGSNPSNESK